MASGARGRNSAARKDYECPLRLGTGRTDRCPSDSRVGSEPVTRLEAA